MRNSDYREGGAKVEDVAIYTAAMQKDDSTLIEKKIGSGEIDWVTFASPSAVKGFLENISSDIINSSKIKVASIGPVTSKKLESHGVNINVTADEHTLEGLLDAIEQVYINK